MKTITLFLLFAGSFYNACTNQKGSVSTEKNSPVKLISASKQDWTAGIKDGGRGTEYYIKVLTKDKNVTFDSLWVDSRRLKITIPKSDSTSDTLLLRASRSSKDQTEVKMPSGTKGQALIRYSLNQKPYTLQIDTITKLPHSPRP